MPRIHMVSSAYPFRAVLDISVNANKSVAAPLSKHMDQQPNQSQHMARARAPDGHTVSTCPLLTIAGTGNTLFRARLRSMLGTMPPCLTWSIRVDVA